MEPSLSTCLRLSISILILISTVLYLLCFLYVCIYIYIYIYIYTSLSLCKSIHNLYIKSLSTCLRWCRTKCRKYPRGHAESPPSPDICIDRCLSLSLSIYIYIYIYRCCVYLVSSVRLHLTNTSDLNLSRPMAGGGGLSARPLSPVVM